MAEDEIEAVGSPLSLAGIGTPVGNMDLASARSLRKLRLVVVAIEMQLVWVRVTQTDVQSHGKFRGIGPGLEIGMGAR